MNEKKNVIYLHGFASSAKTSKAVWLGEQNEKEQKVNYYAFDFNPSPMDFSYMTITGMINRLRQFILDKGITKPILVGSSMGGLVALHYTKRYGEVRSLLLLAPALSFHFGDEEIVQQIMEAGYFPVFHYAFGKELPLYKEYVIDAQQYGDIIAPPAELTILHGRKDDVVPVELSREYAKRYPEQVNLIELDTDHRMMDQTALIWEWIQKLVDMNP